MAQKFLSGIRLTDGTASAPSLSFSGDSNTGIYWSTYSGTSKQLNISTDGSVRASFNTAGVTSNANFYTSAAGSFRNYSGVWKATTGITGNGFQFITVDSTALTISSTGNAIFTGTIGSGAITSTGKITGTELEGTSLDINGSADISGNITGVDNLYADKVYINSLQTLATSSNFLYIDPNASFSSGIYINNAVKVDGGLLGSYNEDLQLRTGANTRLTLSNSNGSATFAGHIKAGADSTYDVGTNAIRFTNGYFDALHTKGTIQNNTASYIDYKSNQGHRFYIDGNNDDTTHEFQILANTTSYNAGNVIFNMEQTGSAAFTNDVTISGVTSGGAVTSRTLNFTTNPTNAGISGSNEYLIGEVAFSGMDTSVNAAGKYVRIKGSFVDANTNVQGSEGEGGKLQFSLLRHDVGADPRVEYNILTLEHQKATIAGEVEATSLDINGAANIDGLLDVNTGAANTVAIFESTDDKAFIRIKDNDTDTHLISRNNAFSIGDASNDYDNFKVDITSGDTTIAGSLNVGPGPSRFTDQQNAGSRLELYNNRQDSGNVEVYRIAAYNAVEVTGVHFYRGGGGSSGYTKIFAKKNNASNLEEVVQFGTNDALATTFAGEISQIYNPGNTGAFQYLKNANAGSAAYVSKKWQNNDSGFGEIWRNSSTRTSAGQAASSFNMYNNADINFWSGGTHTLELSGNNATFAGTVKAATSFIADAVSTSNNDPGTDNVQVSGYGMIGNRGNLYITNANTDSAANVQIGVGGVHNGSPKLSIGATVSSISTNLHPGADSTYNIGSNASRFANIYADTLYGDGSNLTNVTITETSTLENVRSRGNTINGAINFLPDTGSVLQVDGQTIINRMTSNGAITIGHDDAVIIAGGDTSGTLNSNINNAEETVFIGAEGGLKVFAFPNNMSGGWSAREEWSFANNGVTTFPGNTAVGTAKYTLTVNSPSGLTTTIVNNTINVTFTASTTTNIDYYLVFSSVDGGDYGLISVIPPADFGATMSIIDDSFDVTGTQAYRVYAVKNGVYSSALTGSRAYAVTSAEPTNMSVVNLNKAYYVQWDPPSSNARFVTAYNVYKHEHATQGSLSRSSATLIYSGLNTSYMYSINGANNTNFHQFWVETTIA